MTTGHVKDWHAIYIFWRQPLVASLASANIPDHFLRPKEIGQRWHKNSLRMIACKTMMGQNVGKKSKRKQKNALKKKQLKKKRRIGKKKKRIVVVH